MNSRISRFALPVALVAGSCMALAQTPGQPAQGGAPGGQNALQNGNGGAPQPAENGGGWTPEQGGRIVQEVQHKLLTLPDYDVFDSLSFGIRGKTIILQGYASRPQLKSEAQNAVKQIKGVENVENKIEVLPYSPLDDRIRMAAYQRIYSQPALRKYTGNPVGFGRQPSVAFAAGGITQDPPLGYHAIHIIVNNGHLMLTGVVDSQSDADIAKLQANQVPGAFSVVNNLQVAGKRPGEK